MTTFLFAGQGAQYVGMGRDLYDNFSESRSIFEEADAALGFSISSLCFSGPAEELIRTQNSQPAIMTASIAAFEAFKAIAGRLLPQPAYTAGLSLGEYSALVAAGAMDFRDAVYLVRKRGEFMEEAGRRNPGTMLSVLGMDLDKVRQLCMQTHTEIANINCPGQVVISGGLKEIEEARELAGAQGAKRAVILEVSGAFHSSFMKEASLKLSRELDKIKISMPRVAVVSNVTARPVNSVAEIRDNLTKQVGASVLWEDSMKFILSQNISNFIEFGPGRVLKGLMRRIDETARVVSIEKKEDIVNFKVNQDP
ncbi:MAG: ACP S-malonyltransferase [Candidatus Omnitrophica bacterium]|nr:ACP S-malonyltransferase [Candidatus Omnitrophota bacterium]